MGTNGELKIEKGIPIPPVTIPPRESLLAQFTVGDSVFFAGGNSAHLRNAASYQNRRRNKKFNTRTVTENGVKGVRVWRIA